MICPRCHQKAVDGEELGGICPGCGALLSSLSLDKKGAKAAFLISFVSAYFKSVFTILVRPSKFFRAMPLTGGLAAPLAFALVTHWIGSAVGYLWRQFFDLVLTGEWENYWRGFFPEVDSPARGAQWAEVRDQMMHWFWGVGSVIADPFTTLAMILVTSTFVFIGARLFVSDSEGRRRRDVTFESATRIVAYGMTPSVLGVFPVIGGFVAALWAIVSTVIGAKQAYRVSTPRAFIIALFPKLLVVGLVMGFIALLFVFALQLFVGVL